VSARLEPEQDTPVEARRPKRASVHLDRFAWSQIARECNLTSTEMLVLLALTMLANFRDATWSGTTSTLAEDTRTSRRTTAKALEHLLELGLIEQVTPFGQNREGRVRVLCYGALVTDVRDDLQAVLVASASTLTASLPHYLENNPFRSPIVQLSANRARIERESSANQARMSKRSPAKDSATRCAYPGCAEPIDGHIFTDHEPVAPNDSPLTLVADPWEGLDELTDEEIGLFPRDREELDELLAEENTPAEADTTLGEAETLLLRTFPGAELVSA
jgi:predicted transcriptional regulator